LKIARPESIRLLTRARAAVTLPLPPFGIPSWSDEPTAAVAVWLEVATNAEGGDLASMAAQIPRAETLRANTTVVVLPTAIRPDRGWLRVFGERALLLRNVPRALRCTALLVRGYVDIEAEPEAAGHRGEPLVWGRAPEL
jgi:hypothetical protein